MKGGRRCRDELLLGGDDRGMAGGIVGPGALEGDGFGGVESDDTGEIMRGFA